MASGRGKARNVGTSMWEIVDPSGNRLSVFNHDRFPNIWDGAQVLFVDADGDGISESVQSAADVNQLVGLAAPEGVRFGWGARSALNHHVVKALSGAGTSEEIEALFARIGGRAVESRGPVTLRLLREHGVIA